MLLTVAGFDKFLLEGDQKLGIRAFRGPAADG